MVLKPMPPIILHSVIICGDREYKVDYVKIVRREIRKLTQKHGTHNLLVIAGGAPGVDSIAKLVAKNLNVHVAEIEALWDTRGKSAGPQRNMMMAALGPSEVIAVHNDFENSRGTRHMVTLSKKLGIPVRLLSR